MQTVRRSAIVSVVLASFAAAQSAALAETLLFRADLNGASEVPSTDIKGIGTVSAQYDTATQMLSWMANYSGLTGNVIAANFNGPATVRQEGTVSLRVNGALTSPIEGAATLDKVQAADLKSGNWYFNIHTLDHKTGEIRGQLVEVNPPHTHR